MNKQDARQKRHKRLRRKISGTDTKPRVSIFRSNKHIYVQVVDDMKSRTVVSYSDVRMPKKEQTGTKSEIAKKVGAVVGKEMKARKISEAVFDRSGYKYHGRVKAVAEGIRESGIHC